MLMHSASTLKWGEVLTPMLLGGVLRDILRSLVQSTPQFLVHGCSGPQSPMVCPFMHIQSPSTKVSSAVYTVISTVFVSACTLLANAASLISCIRVITLSPPLFCLLAHDRVREYEVGWPHPFATRPSRGIFSCVLLLTIRHTASRVDCTHSVVYTRHPLRRGLPKG